MRGKQRHKPVDLLAQGPDAPVLLDTKAFAVVIICNHLPHWKISANLSLKVAYYTQTHAFILKNYLNIFDNNL